MFKEILKIIPKLDNSDLAKMEKQLQSRFTKIAKGFGKGVAGAFKGGGIAGIALGLIDKLLNPLQEVKESIDRILTKSDDLATNAAQFNTTTGKLVKLVGIAKSTGLDEGNLYTLINKFQGATAAYNANPMDAANSSVANYAGEKDAVEGFFKFIQALQKLPKDQQLLVQAQVFGEKQVLKMADFLQTDFQRQYKALGFDKLSTAKLGTSVDSLAAANDLQDTLNAQRETKDYITKARLINTGLIRQKGASSDLELQRENNRLAQYDNLAAISKTMDQVMMLVEEGLGQLGSLIKTLTPMVNKVIEAADRLLKSPVVQGVKSFFGGKGD